MAEWTIAGLLGAVVLILYVELRESARAHRLMEKGHEQIRQDLVREFDKLDRRMELSHEAIVRNSDQMARAVRDLQRVVHGEGA